MTNAAAATKGVSFMARYVSQLAERFEREISKERTKRAQYLLSTAVARTPDAMRLLHLFADPAACKLLKETNPTRWYAALSEGERLRLWPVDQLRPEAYAEAA
jgi:hypothetical protein